MTEKDSASLQVRDVKTADGRTVQLTCPVCQSSDFYTSGPDKESKRKGFRHVIIGISGGEELLYKSVKFSFCASCGFVMKFMIPEKGEEK